MAFWTWEESSTGSGAGKVAIVGSLPQGTNNIGDVDVLTLPALPAGTNNIGTVQLTAEGSNGGALPAKSILLAGNDPLSTVLNPLRTAARDSESGAWILAVGMAAYNGTSFDRWRNNTEGILLASAARTATIITANQVNHNARGVVLILKITVAGTGNLTPALQIVDPVTGDVRDYVSGVAQSGVNLFSHAFYPGSSTGAEGNLLTNKPIVLPRTWAVKVQHADASSWTYSLGYSLII